MAISHSDPISETGADTICEGALPPEAIRGIACYNRQEFFDAHEHLETAWRAERRPVRYLYQGILQVAVCFHHIKRGNYSGSLKVLRRARATMANLPGDCQGIDLAFLRGLIDQVEAELLRLGPENLAAFDWSLHKLIILQSSSL
jgi:uncharacterized protein